VLQEHPQVRSFVCREEGGVCEISPGPWYDSSLKIVQSGHVAIANFRIDGPAASSDVWMRAQRPGGGSEEGGSRWPSTLLYNTLGPGAWELLSLEATLKTEGGIAKRVDLLEAVPAPSLPGQ